MNKSFLFLMFIIFSLPIPLGSNRPWAWNLFEIAIFSLTISQVIFRFSEFQSILTKYKTTILLFLSVIILCGCQLLPLPEGLVQTLSPIAYDAYSSADAKQYFLSVDPGQTHISLIKLLSMFCLMICTFILVNTEHKIRLLLITITAAGTFQAFYGSIEVLLGLETSLIFKLDVNQSATGTYVYKNHYANFLVICLSAGIGLLVAAIQKSAQKQPKPILRRLSSLFVSNKAIIRICLAIMVIGLVMSRSRMGNIAFFVSMTFVGLLALLLIKKRSKNLTILLISLFVVDVLIVSTYFGLGEVKERLAQTSFERETRDEVLKDAIPMLSDFPITGTGAGSFYTSFPRYQSEEILLFYDHLHNDYVQFAIEFGLPGLLLFAIIVCIALYNSLSAMYLRKKSTFKGAAFACSMAIVGMLLHMTVDFPLQAYANACYFIVIITLCSIVKKLKPKSKRKKSKTITSSINYSNPDIGGIHQ